MSLVSHNCFALKAVPTKANESFILSGGKKQKEFTMIEHKNLSDDQLKTHMHTIFTKGNPGGDIVGGATNRSGQGFATGHHLEAIICGQEVMRRCYKKHGCIKPAALEFIEEFVRDAYSAEIFSFLMGGYEGDDLTSEDWDEIRQAFRNQIAAYYP